MKLTYSLNKQCIGKDHSKLGLLFHPVITDLETFLDSHYLKGQCIATGIFLTGYRNTDNWIYSSMIIIDIDENLYNIDDIWDQSFVKKYCFAAIPSSSYTAREKKYHLYFALDKPVQTPKYYRRFVQWVSNQIEAVTDASMVKPAQPCYGTSFTKIKHTKSLNDSLLRINREADYLDYDYIYSEIKRLVNDVQPIDLKQINALSLTHNGNNAVSKRAKRHKEQPPEMRKQVTIEALSYALKEWGRQEYDLWLAMLMSAFDGSFHQDVLRYIIEHPDIIWEDNEKNKTVRWWNSHKPKQDGYTVATLFLLARHNGWLQKTSVDLEPADYQNFNAKDVGEWLQAKEPLPKRALIHSGLGTSKTLGSIDLLISLGTPKSVFFAPSIKLCTNLSAILTAKGVENTLYIDSGVIKDTEILKAANVLVITLQSFANKLIKKETNISDYTFICIDECDELISSFVRSDTGGTLGFSSHVRKIEAQWGLYALEQIFENVPYIYMLDGTATKISKELADRFTLFGEPLKVYKNTWVRTKPPVFMLNSIYEARKIAIDAISEGYKTVIAADTKQECRLLYEYILEFGLVPENQVIMITGETHNQTDVRGFFKDVEAGAKEKQVVIYNSAMGSGVSITETCPAVFVQICAHLSPRKNLQLLNRYRQQSLVYVYTQRGENLYHTSVQERIAAVQSVLSEEQSLSGLNYEKRSHIAEITKDLAAMAVTDEYEQRRSYRDYYIGLLKVDGRLVQEPLSDIQISEDFKQDFGKAKVLIEEQEEEVLSDWRSVDPISRTDPPPLDISLLDYAKGLLHTRIDNFIPEGHGFIIDDKDLAFLVVSHSGHVRLLERYLSLEKALKTTLENSQNKRSAMTTYKLYLSRLECISQLGLLFPNSVSEIPLDEIKPEPFLRAIELRKHTYNLIARRSERSHEKIIYKFSHDPVEAALSMAKALLRPLGLAPKRVAGKRTKEGRVRKVKIKGNDEVTKLLQLRGHNVSQINFDIYKLLDYSTQIKPLTERYLALDPREQRDVMERLKEGVLTFEDNISLTDVLL
jgi:hypothetical protein